MRSNLEYRPTNIPAWSSRVLLCLCRSSISWRMRWPGTWPGKQKPRLGLWPCSSLMVCIRLRGISMAARKMTFECRLLMKPFEKHRDDLLILDNMGDFGFSSHTNSARRFLSPEGVTIPKLRPWISFIADKIGGDTPQRSLELTTEGLFTNQIGCSYISFDQKGGFIPRESDPQLIFDRLFRNPMSDPTSAWENARACSTASADDARNPSKENPDAKTARNPRRILYRAARDRETARKHGRSRQPVALRKSTFPN